MARVVVFYQYTGSATSADSGDACRARRAIQYIRYYGLWDTDELYDLAQDPQEIRNLVWDPAHRDVVARMNRELFEGLAATDGLYIPLAPDRGGVQNLRRRGGSTAADFPPEVFSEAPR